MSEQQSNDHHPNVTPHRLSLLALLFPALLLASALFSSGCSVYSDLTAYFNTYYNAQHLFDNAVSDIEKSPQKDRDTNYFARYAVPPSSVGMFDSIIAKCSKVIQFHGDSKYAEPAIVMIAKSYAYQGEYELALQKFNELLTNFPNSGERYNAKLWVAKTQYFDKKYDDALASGKAVAEEAAEADQKDVQIEALMLQAQIYFDRKDYDVATDLEGRALAVDGSNELRVIAAYQLGQDYEQLGKTELAAKAYKSVRSYHPDLESRFKADLRYGIMLATMGQHMAALQMYDDLMYDATKPEEKAILNFQMAKTYTAMGDTGKAFDFYRYIDTVYRNTPAIDKSLYERGQLFETEYKDLKSALEYYRRGQNGQTEEALKCKAKADIFGHYFTVRQNIADYDSMLHPELYRKAGADSTDSSRIAGAKGVGDSLGMRNMTPGQLTDTAKLSQVDLAHDTTAGKPADPAELSQVDLAHDTTAGKDADPAKLSQVDLAQDTTTAIKLADKSKHLPLVIPNRKVPTQPEVKFTDSVRVPDSTKLALKKERPVPDSPAVRLAKQEQPVPQESPLGNIPAPPAGRDTTHLAGKLPDESEDPDTISRDNQPARFRNNLRDKIRRRDDAFPGGRRRPEVPDTINGVLQTGKQAPTNTPAPPRVALTPDTLRKLIARSRFELAGIYFLELRLPDSAETIYREIIADSLETPYRAAALYALAEIRRTQNDTVSTDSLYTVVATKYPRTEFARKIQKLRGQDTVVQASPKVILYAVAQESLRAGNSLAAMKILRKIAADTADTAHIVAKALYSIGWIYENIIIRSDTTANDSAAAMYKNLMKRFPGSVYAEAAKPKVSVKDDPKTLSQFVNIKEISATGRKSAEDQKGGKGGKGKEGLKGADSNEPQDENQDNEDELQRRTPDRDVDQDTEEDDTNTDEDVPPLDDENNNNN